MELHQRLHATMPTASRSTTSRSSTGSSTSTKPPACARWSSWASCPRTSPPNPEPYQVHYPERTISGGSNNPPKDYAHVGRTGAEGDGASGPALRQGRGAKWYFEVWNEPDIDYWHGTPEDYCKLYDYAVAGVRAALPGAQGRRARQHRARLRQRPTPFWMISSSMWTTGKSAADGQGHAAGLHLLPRQGSAHRSSTVT